MSTVDGTGRQTCCDVRTTRQTLVDALDTLGPVPLSAGGETERRFEAFVRLGADDLAVARLADEHLDAVAICAEADREAPPWLSGMWASDPPFGRLTATMVDGSWRLNGTKLLCSGGHLLDSALVTAHADDGYRLFVVRMDASGVELRSTWSAVGMRGGDTVDVDFDGVFVDISAAVGGPGWYLDQHGFWIGGIGVAACWYGGALGALRALRAAVVARRDDDHHGLAHLGAADALCAAMWARLRVAADDVDDGHRRR